MKSSAAPPAFRAVPLDRSVHVVSNLPPTGGCLWWHDDDGFAAWGEAARIEVGDGPARFKHAAAELAATFAAIQVNGPAVGTPIAVGSFTFDPLEQGSILVIPRLVLRRDRAVLADGAELPVLSYDVASRPPLDRARFAGAAMSELTWLEAVSTAVDDIEHGRLDKVVLARDELVWAKTPFDEGAVAARLIERYPGCYTFACGGLVGASPELLVRKRGTSVESLVLAGSGPRSIDPEHDEAIGRKMLNSDKERCEHALAVASVLDPLRQLCEAVQVEETPHLLRLANVQHLATRVQAKVDASVSVLELVGVLHPTAAVCGVPRIDALGTIRAAEGGLRGRYAGPVGWVDASGDGEWAIALRCAQITGTRARLFAGAGIVAGSMPEDELEETRLKLRAMQDALGAAG